MAQIAKQGDEAKSKAAFFDVANACKACHDKYRAD
jgi:cytochrome c556